MDPTKPNLSLYATTPGVSLSVPMQPFGTPNAGVSTTSQSEAAGSTPTQQVLLAAALRQQQQQAALQQAVQLHQQQLQLRQQMALLQAQQQQRQSAALLSVNQLLNVCQQAPVTSTQHTYVHALAAMQQPSLMNQMQLGQLGATVPSIPSTLASMLPQAVVDPQPNYEAEPQLSAGYTASSSGGAKEEGKSKNWTTHRTADGRLYYHNVVTKQTTWHKPDELKTLLEKLKEQTPWKEYTTPEGKIYYYHSQTKETTWTMPTEFANIKEKLAELENTQTEREAESPSRGFKPVNFLEQQLQSPMHSQSAQLHRQITPQAPIESPANNTARPDTAPIIGPQLPPHNPDVDHSTDPEPIPTAMTSESTEGIEQMETNQTSNSKELELEKQNDDSQSAEQAFDSAQEDSQTETDRREPSPVSEQSICPSKQATQLSEHQTIISTAQQAAPLIATLPQICNTGAGILGAPSMSSVAYAALTNTPLYTSSASGLISTSMYPTISQQQVYGNINLEQHRSEIDRAMQATLSQLPQIASGVPAPEVVRAVAETVQKLDNPVPTKPTVLYPDKKAAIEAFKQMLKDHHIPPDATWDGILKTIQKDTRFRALHKLGEKKQAFNAYKAQRNKEERDMKRLMFKKSKEDLEGWLRDGCDGVLKHSFTFKKADNMFGNKEIWTNVPKETRKEIFNDVIGELRKKEKENRKEQRMKNIKKLAFIFENLLDITRETTWAEAQRQLAERDEYMKDRELQNMDREDALIVFQEHIFASEAEHAKELENAQIRKKRQGRKRREDFGVYLDELRNKGIINCMSLWSELYHIISGDPRFSAMLAQPGSTPLDLFKFYVEALKQQYVADRKIMKELIAEKKFTMTPDRTLDEFCGWMAADSRTAAIDHNNVKMYFTALKDKVISEQSNKQAEENRKKNRLVDAFRAMLKSLVPPITPETTYCEIKEKIVSTTAYLALDNDALAEKIFANFINEIKDACVGVHAPIKKMRTDEGLQFSFRAGKRRGRGGASKRRQTKALEPVCTDDEDDENAIFES